MTGFEWYYRGDEGYVFGLAEDFGVIARVFINAGGNYTLYIGNDVYGVFMNDTEAKIALYGLLGIVF
jgi:hypothetical protein